MTLNLTGDEGGGGCRLDSRPLRINPNQYIDRHIGAFIAARYRNSVNSELYDMDNRADKYTPIVAAAKLLSSV